MKTYRFQVVDGRRLSGYQVDAGSEGEARELFVKYLSFLGVVLCEEIVAKEDEVDNG